MHQRQPASPGAAHQYVVVRPAHQHDIDRAALQQAAARFAYRQVAVSVADQGAMAGLAVQVIRTVAAVGAVSLGAAEAPIGAVTAKQRQVSASRDHWVRLTFDRIVLGGFHPFATS